MNVHDPSSALYHGTLSHTRRATVLHQFSYRTYQLLLNLDELPELARKIWPLGLNRWALTSFHERDHLHGGDTDIREKLARLLRRGKVALPGGPVLLLTHLRVLGYVFNPVSFYYCLDAQRQVKVVVAEVNNTFGERHCYILTDLRPARGGVVAEADKVFHVSPFFPVEGRYRFYFSPPEHQLAVRIELRRNGQLDFWADFTATRARLTATSLLAALARVPFVTLQTILGIHWQALHLWRKGAPLYRKPESPPSLLKEGL